MKDKELKEKIAQELSSGKKQYWTIEDYRNQAKIIFAFIKEADAEARKKERERIQALYENMGCVPEEDNCWYRFWQALKGGE